MAKRAFLYLVECGCLSKIGVAVNPLRRITELPNPYSDEDDPPLKKVVGIWDCGDSAREIEADVKLRFKQRRFWGYEWFSVKADVVLMFLQRLLDKKEAVPVRGMEWTQRPVGRPAMFTEERAKQLAGYLNKGLSVAKAAAKMKLSRSGIYLNYEIEKKRGKFVVSRKRK
jgi:hypothetical protein